MLLDVLPHQLDDLCPAADRDADHVGQTLRQPIWLLQPIGFFLLAQLLPLVFPVLLHEGPEGVPAFTATAFLIHDGNELK